MKLTGVLTSYPMFPREAYTELAHYLVGEGAAEINVQSITPLLIAGMQEPSGYLIALVGKFPEEQMYPRMRVLLCLAEQSTYTILRLPEVWLIAAIDRSRERYSQTSPPHTYEVWPRSEA